MLFAFVLRVCLARSCARSCVPHDEEAGCGAVEVPRPRRVVSSSQLVLIKVPETGSSTAANLLADVAERFNVSCWGVSGCDADEKKATWSLGHRSWAEAKKSHDLKKAVTVTTVRTPSERVASNVEKSPQKNKGACHRALGIAAEFWGVKKSYTEGSARDLVARFDSVWVTERYNESLVVFALRFGLSLGDVLPTLSKFHVPTKASLQLRKRLHANCDKLVADSHVTRFEAHVHRLANEALDNHLQSFAARIDLARVLRAFSTHLDIYMNAARLRPAERLHGQATAHSGNKATLLEDECLRRCAAAALDSCIPVDYVPR